MRTTPAKVNNDQGVEKAEQPDSFRGRREFIKSASRALGAGVASIVLCDLFDLRAFAQEPEGAELTPQPVSFLTSEYDWTKHSYVYLVDTRKCIGCGSCVRACSRENNVPDEYFRTWVERYQIPRFGVKIVDSPNGGMDGFPPSVTGKDITKAFFFPKLCCHCTHTPCVQLCPVGASYRTKEGVILVDDERCVGCGYCVQACPYGSRFIHPETHTASKCSLCYHRITKGMTTACIQACPVGARMLGDKKKAGDMVAEIIATQPVHVLQPELLTEPNCFYLGLSWEAR